MTVYDVGSTDDLIKGVLLLILASSGNYIGNTFNCVQQRALSKSFFVKHLVILLIIFFSLNFVSSKADNPWKKIYETFLIWTLFLCFTKLSLFMTGIVTSLLGFAYFISTWIDYSSNDDNKISQNDINDLKSTMHYTSLLILIILLINFVFYLMQKDNIAFIFKPHHMFKDDKNCL